MWPVIEDWCIHLYGEYRTRLNVCASDYSLLLNGTVQPSNRNIIREYLADSLVSDFLDFGQSFQINMDPFWGDNVPLFMTHSLPVKVSGLRNGLDSMQDGQVNLFLSRNEDLFDRAVMVCEVQSNNSRKVTNGVEFVHIFLVLKRHGTKHDRCRRTSVRVSCLIFLRMKL